MCVCIYRHTYRSTVVVITARVKTVFGKFRYVCVCERERECVCMCNVCMYTYRQASIIWYILVISLEQSTVSANPRLENKDK
jgi:hypothetical protein